jgi:hypothetical protein
MYPTAISTLQQSRLAYARAKEFYNKVQCPLVKKVFYDTTLVALEKDNKRARQIVDFLWYVTKHKPSKFSQILIKVK